MKILKAGKPQPIPKTKFVGTCKVCGAEVAFNALESVIITTESLFRTKRSRSTRCPTLGCKGSIEAETEY